MTPVLGQSGFTSFPSTTEDSVLTITSVNAETGEIKFTVTHQFLDDGVSGTPWPGDNHTPFDKSTLHVTVADDDTGWPRRRMR